MTHQSVQSTSIAAPPEAVFRAIVGPQGLATWLADEAFSERRAGGRIALRWSAGQQAMGRWTAYEPPTRAAFRAVEDENAVAVSFSFDMRAEGAGSAVSLTLQTAEAGPLAPWTTPWRHALEDLRLFCEQGGSGAQRRRPLMGINFDELTDALVAARALPTGRGVLVKEAVADSGAARAGIAPGDVIVAIGGVPVWDWPTVGTALDRFVAGDTVPTDIWRGSEQHTIDVVVGTRPVPDLPTDIDAVLTAWRTAYESGLAAIRAATDGASDAQASFAPGDGEWSAKQVIVHLSDLERWFSDDTARVAADEPSVGWADEALKLRSAALCTWPLSRLLDRLALDMWESLAVTERALRSGPPSARLQVAVAMTWSPDHIREHVAQIQADMAAARAAGIQ